MEDRPPVGALRDWIRVLAVAAGYGVAFFAFRRAVPFSLASPWFVFVAMICFLGLASMAGPIVAIRMPRPLRRIGMWEAGGRLYRALGVPMFGRLLRQTPLRVLNRNVYLSATSRNPATVTASLEAAEASHFFDAVLVAPYMVFAALQGAWGTVLWFAIAQVLVNVYPMMHLRLTRHRLDRLASRRSLHPDRCD